MAIGRITGSVLKSNLTRNGVDLAFETNLLYLDVTNNRVGIGTSEPSTALHVVGNTTITGDLSVSGNIVFEAASINSLDTGAISINDNTITGSRSNEDIVIQAAGTGRIVLKNTLVANAIESDDSTAIQINDGVNISGTLNAKTLITNTIGSEDSSAIQINDAVNVSGTLTATGLVANGITYPSTDGSANQVLTTNGAGVLSFTSLSAFTGITFVGDDSTGSTINTAETFKITGTQNITTAVSGDTLTITGPNLTGYAQKTDTAITLVGDDSTGTAVTVGETFKILGGSNITTSVTGDTLTINGSNPAQGITFVGDDSTGTRVSDGETLKITGSGGITTAMSGDVLTVSINSLDTSGLLIDDNKITGSRSNEDIEISTSGTGVITTNASIIPTTDNAIDLGSQNKRFREGYFGPGSLYVGDQTISSSKTGFSFSGRINTPTSMLDEDAKLISKIGIDTSTHTVDSMVATDNRAAMYYQVYRDEVNNQVIASKVNLVHDGQEAFMTESGVVSTGTIVPNDMHTSEAAVAGDNLLYKITGQTAINSVTSYKTTLNDDTTSRSIGSANTVHYNSLSTAVTVLDTFNTASFRSAKYFVVVSELGPGIPNEHLTAEICVVHDGTDAYVTTYNINSSNEESFVVFTADVSDSLVRLKGQSLGETLNLRFHRLLLADDESSDDTQLQKIIGTVTASSASTAIDSFHMTDAAAAFYTISAHDSNNTQSSVSEVVVVHDGTNPYLTVGPHLTTDGTNHLTFSVTTRGNKVILQAAGSEGEVKISAYRIILDRPAAGNSNASLSAQGITFVGDDSTGTRISDDETVKIAGGTGITTSMQGDVLTITATGQSTAQGLTFVGDDSTGTRISDGETIKIVGSGGVTTAMSGDVLTINAPTAYTFNVAGDDSTQRAITTGNTIRFVGANGISTTTDAQGNITISGTTLVTLNIDAAGSAVVYDISALNLDGGSSASTYGAGETSVNGDGA